VEATLDVYLTEINETGLLTAAEEIELADRIRAGDPEARDRMIRANLRLVVNIAKHFVNRGLGFMDLVAEGNLGLLKAVEKFDPAAGCRFSTYGTWWIKQSIRRALTNTTKTIRVPSYMLELISRLKAAQLALFDQLGRRPTVEETAKELGLPIDGVHAIQRAIESSSSGARPISIDADACDEDHLTDDRVRPPDELILEQNQLERLRRLLDRLGTRTATVLRLRYGLEGESPLTLKEIGKRVGLTRERVRQIEVEALQQLADILEAN
jgi:RNA polymerase primary sigma factor